MKINYELKVTNFINYLDTLV